MLHSQWPRSWRVIITRVNFTLPTKVAGPRLDLVAGLPNLEHVSVSASCFPPGELALYYFYRSLPLGSLRSLDTQTEHWLHYALPRLTRLESLSVDYITGLAFLARLGPQNRLRHLKLRCPNPHEAQGRFVGRAVPSLAELRFCPGLQTLQIKMYGLKSLEGLGACTALTRLDISDCPQVEDISPLAPCILVEHLDMTGLDRVHEIDAVAGLSHLRTLILTRTGVRSIGPLSRCTSLVTLSVDRTEVADIGALTGLSGLQELVAAATPLADLTPLSNSQSLRRLYLGGSRARDLAPVLGLPSLKFIQNAMYAYIYVAGKGAT